MSWTVVGFIHDEIPVNIHLFVFGFIPNEIILLFVTVGWRITHDIVVVRNEWRGEYGTDDGRDGFAIAQGTQPARSASLPNGTVRVAREDGLELENLLY